MKQRKLIEADCDILTTDEVKKAVRKEREWLNKYNAVSAVNDGPVEDLEGVPLPGDEFQGYPPIRAVTKG